MSYTSLKEMLIEMLPLLFASHKSSAPKQERIDKANLWFKAFDGTVYTPEKVANGIQTFIDRGISHNGERIYFPHPNQIKEILTGHAIEFKRVRGIYDLIPMGSLQVMIWDDHPDMNVRKYYLKQHGNLKNAYSVNAGFTQFSAWLGIFRYFNEADQARINRERERIARYNLDQHHKKCMQPFKVFSVDDFIIPEGKLYHVQHWQQTIIKEWYKDYENNIKRAYNTEYEPEHESNTGALVGAVEKSYTDQSINF